MNRLRSCVCQRYCLKGRGSTKMRWTKSLVHVPCFYELPHHMPSRTPLILVRPCVLSFSPFLTQAQIDKAVWDELPASLRKELSASLQHGRARQQQQRIVQEVSRQPWAAVIDPSPFSICPTLLPTCHSRPGHPVDSCLHLVHLSSHQLIPHPTNKCFGNCAPFCPSTHAHTSFSLFFSNPLHSRPLPKSRPL